MTMIHDFILAYELLLKPSLNILETTLVFATHILAGLMDVALEMQECAAFHNMSDILSQSIRSC